MSRIPAALLYLTVYNPSIKPLLTVSDDDDEDAEEQAQILFYTARERAVSRDRMLRQVGLAKALVNFTEMFNPGEEPCQNVHSQTRRMIMVSPEPDFWIHACIELPKTPRQPITKGKKQDKKANKGKDQEVIYDYHDGAIHDIALKTHLLRGYEQFKLTHGSFTSVMANLGQQALELQLERFFTVWAWMWDIEEEMDFGEHLGIPLHPFHKLLASHFDIFDSSIPADAIPLLLSPPCLIPSSRFTELDPPISLARHVLSLITSHRANQPRNAEKISESSDTIKASDPDVSEVGDTATGTSVGEQHTGGFLAMPNVGMPTMSMPNMNLKVDVRKWTWPGYLTFGKTSTSKGAKSSKSLGDEVAGTDSTPQEEVNSTANVSVEADTHSLEDSITSDAVDSMQDEPQNVASFDAESQLPSRITSDDPAPVMKEGMEPAEDISELGQDISPPQEAETQSLSPSLPPGSIPSSPKSESTETPPIPPLVLSRTYVHLADVEAPWMTTKRRLFYLTKDEMTFAVVDGHDPCLEDENLNFLTETIVKFIEKVLDVISEEKHRCGTERPVTVAKILQPKDSHVFSLENLTFPSSSGFKSTSEHLYQGQQLLRGDSDILEVFSRGQNPQHWHVSRRGLGTDKDGSPVKGEVYLESARKESSLADVDNELAGAVRRFVAM